MNKGIGGILVILIMIASVAAVVPIAGGVLTKYYIDGYKRSDTGAGLPGWTIEVYDPDNVKVGYDTTDEDGYWQVCGLLTGKIYTVTEVLQPGWTQIEPETVKYTIKGTTNGDVVVVDSTTGNEIDLVFINVPTNVPGTGTPGYWKNHPEAWPVDTITIGGEPYTKADAIATMSMPDGDKTYTMFRALVCAKLNVWIGNDASCIAGTITAADAWMATYGPAGSGVHADEEAWQLSGEDLYELLDDYNNGELCAPSRDTLDEEEETETSETVTTTETTTQENGKGKKKPKK
jgi:hypothetical protein